MDGGVMGGRGGLPKDSQCAQPDPPSRCIPGGSQASPPPPRKTEPLPMGSGSLLKARTPPPRNPKRPPELWGVGVALGPLMVTEAPKPPSPGPAPPVRPPAPPN